MRRDALWIVTIIAAAGVIWLSSTYAKNESDTKTPATTKASAMVGSPAPAFTLEDQNSKKVNLSSFAGKVVVLEWVNPDCPFVQRHYKAQTMTRLEQKYRGSGVVWLAINSTNYMSKENNGKWREKHQLAYPILDDHPGHVGKLYGAKTTPHMYIISPSGVLVYNGAIDDDPGGEKQGKAMNYVEKALEELLTGKPLSTPETSSYGCSVKYAKGL
ncbi:MAG: redoxin domain-containing protein [Candidatus Latescibacteria bacterium]|nr:redoxin domain-containing protein [Candidatus Latescibacterota bacterium]